MEKIEIPIYRFVKTELNETGEQGDLMEEDTIPESPEYETICILKTNFPRVTASMTAERAGQAATLRCIQNKWAVTPENIWAALANLEIDLD